MAHEGDEAAQSDGVLKVALGLALGDPRHALQLCRWEYAVQCMVVSGARRGGYVLRQATTDLLGNRRETRRTVFQPVCFGRGQGREVGQDKAEPSTGRQDHTSNIVTACFLRPAERLPIMRKAVSVESKRKAMRLPRREARVHSPGNPGGIDVEGVGRQ